MFAKLGVTIGAAVDVNVPYVVRVWVPLNAFDVSYRPSFTASVVTIGFLKTASTRLRYRRVHVVRYRRVQVVTCLKVFAFAVLSKMLMLAFRVWVPLNCVRRLLTTLPSCLRVCRHLVSYVPVEYSD